MAHLSLTRVPSLTAPGRGYGIEQRGTVLACECPAFAFGKRGGKTCKHLRIYRAAERALDRCQDQHHGDGTRLCRQCLVVLLAAVAAKALGKERKHGTTRCAKRASVTGG